jgi:hypothetical protein
MKRQNAAEGKLEEILWEKSRKYARGEITAKELKNTLSSRAEEVDKNLRIVLTIITALCVVGGIVLYLMTKELIILLTLGTFIVPITQITTYYFKKRK